MHNNFHYKYPAILPGIRRLAGVPEPNMHVSGLDQPIHNFDPTEENINRILEIENTGSGPIGCETNRVPVELEQEDVPMILIRRQENFGVPTTATTDMLFKIVIILFILALAYYVITRQ